MLEDYKVGRWKELFESFEKAFFLLTHEVEKETTSISEAATLVHFHEMCLEHARKTLYGYLDAKGISVKTPRQAIKESSKLGVLASEKSWSRAFNRRNLGYFLFTEKVEKEIVQDIKEEYYPMYTDLQQRMKEEME
ncbi:hypothetical protein FPQ13_08460 [Allobacillus salarius]|uniref:Nucleotidyltransferase n=1 Tax=Allobacillus salarius TaxID=1955272 RepID=A0A556PKQ6_9BACI|nr:hypothetical protein FPQ13_08460 [Allobacillus salarius]